MEPLTPNSALRLNKEVWTQFRKSKMAFAALVFLIFLVIVAVFANIIANNRPLYCTYNGVSHFPVFNSTQVDSIFDEEKCKFVRFAYDNVDWRKLNLTSVIWAPIPYSAESLDPHNRDFKKPGEPQFYENAKGEMVPLKGHFQHLLGTNKNGQDLLAGIVYGARISLMIGIISIGIAAFIGILLGSLAGYFGNTRLKVQRGGYYMAFAGIFLAYFYGFYVRKYTFQEAGEQGINLFIWELFLSLVLCGVIFYACARIGKWLNRFSFFAKEVSVPVDSFVSRGIEVLKSVPVILLVISFAIVFGGGLWFVMIIIGLTGWPGIARLIRAEFLKISSLNFMEPARALGYSDRRMILKHAIPNSLPPVLVAITFGIAAAILAESTLSFLNIGVDENTVTWGKLLNTGRSNFDSWWFTVFPGLAIFLTVLSFNLLGERLRDVLDPRGDER